MACNPLQTVLPTLKVGFLGVASTCLHRHVLMGKTSACRQPLTCQTPAPTGAKDLEFKTYPGLAHERCTEEMHDLRAFLLRALPA